MNKQLKILLYSLLIINIFFFGYLITPTGEVIKEEKTPANLTKVIDGDTIETELGTVRLVGVNTPEAGRRGSEEATQFLEQFQDEEIYLIKTVEDTGQYGRLLRYVYVDGTFVNAELVAEGYATARIFDPDDRYSQILVQLEQYAKMRELGLWATESE